LPCPFFLAPPLGELAAKLTERVVIAPSCYRIHLSVTISEGGERGESVFWLIAALNMLNYPFDDTNRIGFQNADFEAIGYGFEVVRFVIW